MPANTPDISNQIGHNRQKNSRLILGMLGGGQLGRMFTQAAQKMGFEVCVFCPEAKSDSPAASIAEHHIQAEFSDENALQIFAKKCIAASTEFENIPAETLAYLKKQGLKLAPDADALIVAQHRIREKNFFREHGVPTTDFYIIEKKEDLEAVPANFYPAILKTVSLGYDGKGQASVNHFEQALLALQNFNINFNINSNNEAATQTFILEKRVDLDHEISIILARDFNAQVQIFPAAHNTHHDGILMHTEVPSFKTTKNIIHEAKNHAKKIADALNYHGVLCIEFFVTRDQKLLANEMAPRPHNSGHYTQDACASSQFDQQVAVLADLPLPSTDLLCPALMVNILGQAWDIAAAQNIQIDDYWKLLKKPNVQLHLYGKDEAKIGRKMGHVNALFSEFSGFDRFEKYLSPESLKLATDKLSKQHNALKQILLEQLWGQND